MTYQWANCRYAGAMKEGHEKRAMPESLAERGALPRDVFCFPEVDSWRERVWRLISDYITHEVKATFTRRPPEYVVSDDLSWLNEIVLHTSGRDVEMKSLLADRLAGEYRAFRAAHGTRTDDLAPFYEHGLRCLRADEAENRARALFMTPEFAWVTEDKIDAAIADMDARNLSGGREGRLYFCADERSLITRNGGCGHYLVYGGEYLYCLGLRLVSRFDAQRVLKSIGRPTMFVCDIPIAMMQHSTLEEFAGSILEFLFCELIGEPSHALSDGAGSALSLAVDLPGKHIVGHYHPARIYDPL
ncbi:MULTISPECIES: hypothetical protein [unclassified Novosphingobium]|uniref:hypothetical protein n=1 Tax=unclassified Novosphingobium TaxID=2644732 RepID=UPI00149481E7|nr:MULTISPECIES: hypothetical protein [unclassified Novosphingobium]MBB3360564.1 hypothetical protein [Novosphingobium sp. BK256]MBB3376967.1 hypothetical protein [Novosphingobium sp. BK280]MBB3381336.1 hypothetical protein [Novosphingobium sp. BK258]MBB3423027.1 hypothetical protein [Novosphingobium sp. BK267]MBB3451730.1 hypothetical protein [Novosphingobium sp. BK352]